MPPDRYKTVSLSRLLDRGNVRWLTCFAVLALSLVCYEANSKPLALTAATSNAGLSDHIRYLRDPGGLLSLDDIAASALQGEFVSGDENLNFGLTRDTVWLRVEVQRTADAPTEWWLEVAPAYIGELSMYLIGGDGNKGIVKPASAGILFPFSNREFKVRNGTFRVDLKTTDPYIIYLKIRSTTPVNVRASLWQPISYVEDSAFVSILLGMYYGALLVVVSLCIMLWRVRRAPTDFWWMIYIAAEGLMMSRMNGLASQYIFSDAPYLIALIGIVSLTIMILASARFSIHAFSLQSEKNKYSYRAVTWIGNLAVCIGLVRIVDTSIELTAAVFLLALAMCLLDCMLSWRFLRSGHPSAVYYFIGSWFMTGCAMLVLARNFGLIPAYEIVDYIWQFNLVIHSGLISLGIVLMHRETSAEQARAANYQADAEANFNLSVMRQHLVSLVSHEFRNALAMVNVSMHAINKTMNLPPDVSERHKNIIRIHRQMRRVIDDFLTEERIEGTSLKVSYRKTEIRSLIEEVVSFGKLIGNNHSISFDLSDVPECLWIDDGILRLILTNLVDNAVKYSAPGSKVLLAASYEKKLLRISVTDNGIGMTPHSLSQLFQRHFKADQQSDGMGIGLYMVKMMLNAHGGNIHVASTPGKGSAVVFWLKPQWCGNEIEVRTSNGFHDA